MERKLEELNNSHNKFQAKINKRLERMGLKFGKDGTIVIKNKVKQQLYEDEMEKYRKQTRGANNESIGENIYGDNSYGSFHNYGDESTYGSINESDYGFFNDYGGVDTKPLMNRLDFPSNNCRIESNSFRTLDVEPTEIFSEGPTRPTKNRN